MAVSKLGMRIPKWAKCGRDWRVQPQWELITDMQFRHDTGYHILKTNKFGWELIEDCQIRYEDEKF